MEENKIITESQLKDIENYINEGLISSKNIFDNLNIITNLLKKLKKKRIILNFYDIVYLINNSKVFNNLLDGIVDFINNNGFNVVKGNILVETLLEDYCSIKGIDLFNDVNDTQYVADSVKSYFQDIGRYKLLTIEEEKNLALRAKNGDKIAKDMLIKHNLRLVITIAKKYTNRGMDYLDVIQNGNMGLIKAVDKYDVDKGFKFSTYATWWIRQTIVRGFHEQQKLIRKPVYLEEEISRMRRVEDILADKLGRNPTYEELAEEMKFTVEKIKKLKLISQNVSSLSEFVGDSDEDARLEEFVVAENNTEEEALSNILQDSILGICESIGLKEREMEILKYRNGFYNNHIYTLEEVGSIYNITRERVRQIEAKALRKLRNHLMNSDKYALNINGMSRKRQIS